ncbi:hypothetical protein EUX98_g7215 [Antrodiella citrinella]|uniref:Lethal giant larvae (Lgl)-like C-terminal domain-containing protein n=1 Tax=Antrodiella citrinella TaxID=2447956 RepID=A0A4S4MNT2_9APHY|nr:hypothetical protein EUX98_g7215 [Antrodiella citrinella]
MWRLYEEKMLARGNSDSSSGSAGSVESQLPLDLMVHPRDLNLLFVVYGGAPGGTGYHSQDILTHRKPSVTAFAIHPSGHFFAVGHADGSIAFWAMEDEDKPLLVRTLDEDDIHLVDANKLDEALSAPKNTDAPREPIFKLSWSGFPNSTDPRGGETVLTILGGLRNDEPPGVTAYLLPAFNPGEPRSPSDPSAGLHPFFKAAMRKSLVPTNAYTYFTKGITQDFLLVPRGSPHFSGTWDPVSIILMSEYAAPPPTANNETAAPSGSVDTEVVSPIDVLTDELANTLEFMQVTDDPQQLRLPPSSWNGPSGIVSGQLVVLERDAYEIFVDDRDVDHTAELRLHGGVAWVEDFQGEMKLMKLQPHRIFMTHHSDLTIRFQDLSAQLLVSSDASPLQRSYPNPLPALTIDMKCVLGDPAIATRTSPTFIDQAHIASMHLASESLECAVVLKTGDVVLYRLIHAGGPHELKDEELVTLHHILAAPGYRFRPEFAIMAKMGPATAFAISDIGFMAVAYTSGTLLIVNMRGPTVLFRGLSETKSSFLHRKDHVDPVVSLTWTVSGTAADATYRVLLIATNDGGSSTIYSLARSQTGTWTVKDSAEPAEAISHPISGGSLVIDARSGARCRANRHGLATALASSPEDAMIRDVRKTIWVSAGAKGAKCVVNITGERVERVDWGSKAGKVERVEIVHKNSAAVLVAFTDRRQALIYSLPFLELLHTVQIERSPSESIMTDSTGDYIELVRHPTSGLISRAIYGTLFNIRRSGPYEPPTVTFTHEKRIMPPQPQPVSVGPTSYIASWIGYITSQGMTGEQMDVLLAGPDRPVAQPTPKDRVIVQDASTASGSTAYDAYSAQAQGMAASAATTASNLYSRLGAALAERTENLGQLQESFDSLEQGSKKMLSQSKSMAAQQTAKRWFGL